ncbi:MAG: hypothetical protein GY869_11350 [Planctomycetes bacterium]|nr:hypothetical protein [Planctomycetota bacterium]
MSHIQVQSVTLAISEEENSNYLLLKLMSLIPKEKLPRAITENMVAEEYIILAGHDPMEDIFEPEDVNSLRFKYLDINSKVDYTKEIPQSKVSINFSGPFATPGPNSESYQCDNWYYTRDIGSAEKAARRIRINAAHTTYWCEEIYPRAGLDTATRVLFLPVVAVGDCIVTTGYFAYQLTGGIIFSIFN